MSRKQRRRRKRQHHAHLRERREALARESLNPVEKCPQSGKNGYVTREAALKAAYERMSAGKTDGLDVYRCRRDLGGCGRFHMGHRNKSSP